MYGEPLRARGSLRHTARLPHHASGDSALRLSEEPTGRFQGLPSPAVQWGPVVLNFRSGIAQGLPKGCPGVALLRVQGAGCNENKIWYWVRNLRNNFGMGYERKNCRLFGVQQEEPLKVWGTRERTAECSRSRPQFSDAGACSRPYRILAGQFTEYRN